MPGRGACALAIVLLLASACGRSETQPVRSPLDDRGLQPTAIASVTFPPPFGTPLAIPTGGPSATAPAGAGDREAAASRAIDTLADRSGLPAGRFTLERAEPVTWPDGCLGVPIPGIACSEALVEGYRIVLRYQSGSLHEVRTGRPGSAVWSPQTILRATVEQVGATLTLVDASGKRHTALVAPGTRLVDVTAAALRPGDRVALGVDDLRDGTPLRVAWLARE